MLTPSAAEIKRLREELDMLRKENELLYKHVITIEKEALESEMRFTQLYKAAFEGIVIYQAGQIVLVNQTTCELLGYDKQEMIGKKVIDFIAPQYRQEAIMLSAYTKTDIFETVCLRKDKMLLPVRIRLKTLPYQGIDQHVMVIYDLTRDKEVEQELVQTELLYQKLFEESRDAIYISGVRGEMLEVNKAALELFGYKKEEMLGMNALRLYAYPEDRENFAREILQKGSVSNYEVTLVKKDGTKLFCILSSTTRRNANMEIIGYQGIIRDITERKRTNELVQAKEVAEKSAVLKAQFLANMSHEIRTPMNAVMGMSNLLKETTLSTEQIKYVKGIKRASEHLLVLINDILDFSKIEAGKLKIESIEFNLSEVLHSVMQTFRIKVRERKLYFKLEVDESVPEILIGDPTRLTQILLNLASNAIKFTEKGGVILAVDNFNEDAKNVTIAFSVIDTGIGIPNEKLKQIFESFSQVGKNTARLFGGTGLGLTITKKLVEMQGGTVSVKSKVGEGSTFIAVIRYPKGDQSLANKVKDENTERQPINNLRILIIEDNELNQVVAKDTIKKWGDNLTIDIAENGQVGVDAIKKNAPYDLVIMDVQMPTMNGYQATAYIRNELQLHDLPILAMTAYATSGEAEKTIIAGMNDYISKPFDPNILYQKIVKLVRYDFAKEPNQNAGQTIEREHNPLPTTASPKNKVTDFTFLNEATGNDSSMKKQMLEIMIRETPEEVALMQKYYEEKNWDRLRAVAHKFKSAVIYMGLYQTQEKVKAIQFNAEKQQNLAKTATLIEEVSQTCKQAVKEMLEELAKL